MKRLLAASAITALVAASPALADTHGPMGGWTGIYLSGAIGAGAVVHEISSPLLPGATFNGIGGEGMFASLGVGYDRQFHTNWVGGVFADFDFGNVSTDLSIPGLGTFSIEQNRTVSIGARLGYLTSPSTLWYGTLGWTRTSFDLKSPLALPISDIGSYSGLFIGGGAESQLGRGWSIKAEYRYSDYGKESVLGLIDIEPSTHTARVGMTYRFNRDDAPAAQPMK